MKTLNLLLIASTIAFAKPPSAASDHFQTGIGKVYAGYLGVQQALASDDLQKAKTGSDSALASLKGIRTKGLDVAVKSHWDSSAARMTTVLQSMASSKDIEALRYHFKDLTPLITDAIEKFGMKPSSSAYLIHCPMANADWLQKDKVTNNPFYGKSMPECGSLVREVKKK